MSGETKLPEGKPGSVTFKKDLPDGIELAVFVEKAHGHIAVRFRLKVEDHIWSNSRGFSIVELDAMRDGMSVEFGAVE